MIQNPQYYRLFVSFLTAVLLSLPLHAADTLPYTYRPRVPAEQIAGTPLGDAMLRKQQRQTGTQQLAPRGLLILAEFSDVPFFSENAHHAFDSLANSADYRYNGAMGSAREYFRDQSDGQYVPQFDVLGPVQLPHTMAYYGVDSINEGQDRYLADFIMDACLTCQDSVDWTLYDNDNDGVIDFVFVLYAGYGQADSGIEETIWPSNWDLLSALYYGLTNQTTYYTRYGSNGNLDYNLPIIDGKVLYEFACANEWNFRTKQRSGIGTFVHEFSHVLGLPDYYTSTGIYPYTPGTWHLMAAGNYLDNGNTPPNYAVHDKYFLGWSTPVLLDRTQTISLPADGNTYYMITRAGEQPAQGPLTADTVYYIENRQRDGWDACLPGHGMLIWQVVYDAAAWAQNVPNDNHARYQLISASGATPYTVSTTGGARQDVPFPGSSNVTAFTPFANSTLSDIYESADGTITFTFTTASTPTQQTILSDQDNNRQEDHRCYNVLGQEVDPATYQGIIIQNGKKRINW